MNICGRPVTPKPTREEKSLDKQFQEWTRLKPSCVSGRFSYYENGQGKNECSHVRRVNKGAGTSVKPLMSCVPLTSYEHHIQTVKGEAALLDMMQPKLTPWTAQEAKIWFEIAAEQNEAEFLRFKAGHVQGSDYAH